MAGLLGALGERTLPHTGFVVRVPAERLYHVDGSPREAYVPQVLVEPTPMQADRDVVRIAGLAFLREALRTPARAPQRKSKSGEHP